MNQFEVIMTRDGDLTVTGGWIIGQRTGGRYLVADLSTQASPTERVSFVGGSGRNVKITNAPGTNVPAGCFRAFTAADLVGQLFPGATMTFHVDGSVDLADDTDVIASAPAGTISTTTVPVGSFSMPSTTYGADTYNGSVGFTLDAQPEANVIPDFRPADLYVMAGTAPVQSFTPADRDHYTGDMDAAWSITVHADGSAVIGDGTDGVAVRAADATATHEASGLYQSTTYGADTYNGGAAYEMVVEIRPTLPLDGYVFVEITETSAGSGEVASHRGPLWGTAIPASAGATNYVPLAYVDTDRNVFPLHQGPIFWG
ncbi:hypothetical protein KBB96_09245 [Luteolibacter ambystomatis]|uniref:Uncharacterized protein n=1 Tax=Luteolibacter ambystomatis TaxID=2824561 RepID=A0A975PGT9_9BACT|nr:hypothetical protein [Luteolibacter ambystomatis]QUE53063.1 hypothetical protein KBB96_09245 [Luteolibacter ambystomatis]